MARGGLSQLKQGRPSKQKPVPEIEKPETARLNVIVPKDFLLEFKAYAASKGESMSTLLRQACREMMERDT